MNPDAVHPRVERASCPRHGTDGAGLDDDPTRNADRESLLPALVLLTLVAGCDERPGSTEPGALSRVAIIEPPVVTLDPGASMTLSVVGYDAAGARISADPVTWRSSSSALVTVAADGTVTTGEWGEAWIYAESQGLADSVAVWVQPPESVPSSFHITLLPVDSVPDWWLAALEVAARRWEQVIRGPLPAAGVEGSDNACQTYLPDGALTGTENGVRIAVTISSQFPAGTYVEAIGGPCVNRGLPYPTTILGRISLNADKFAGGIAPDRLAYVAHHEMGHTLGLVGVVQGRQPPWFDVPTQTYTGLLGLWGYQMDTGIQATYLLTSAAHWTFPDLMGTVIRMNIGSATVGALMDLGYPAAWYGGGPIGVPAADPPGPG
jgi:Bacterial Ig-like domain (group 2)